MAALRSLQAKLNETERERQRDSERFQNDLRQKTHEIEGIQRELHQERRKNEGLLRDFHKATAETDSNSLLIFDRAICP